MTEFKKIMQICGLRPFFWTVIADLQRGFIVKNRFTGEIRVIDK